MRNKYKIPWHVKQYVKQELLDYAGNKALVAKINNYSGQSTRELLLVYKRLEDIDNALAKLSKADRDAADIIFIKNMSRGRAEIEKGLSKAAYYNAMNKIIYITAREMGLI